MSRARWFRMHADDIEVAAAGEGRVLFWGDSITEMWETRGADLWNTHFVPLGALNFGIGGDKTQNLLWRLDHGAVGTLDPEAIILLIGTNNFGLGEATPDVPCCSSRCSRVASNPMIRIAEKSPSSTRSWHRSRSCRK